jgi:Flp pilus assembly protein TadD
MGQASLDLHQPKQAIYYFDQALKLNPRDAQAWCGKAACLLDAKRVAEAQQAYEKAYMLDPNLNEAIMGLARVKGTNPLRV